MSTIGKTPLTTKTLTPPSLSTNTTAKTVENAITTTALTTTSPKVIDGTDRTTTPKSKEQTTSSLPSSSLPAAQATTADLETVIDVSTQLAGSKTPAVKELFAEAGDAAARVQKATTVEMPLRLSVMTGKVNPLAAQAQRGMPQQIAGVVKQSGAEAVFYPADESLKPFSLSAQQAEGLPRDTVLIARATKKKVDFALPDGSVEKATVYQLGNTGPQEPRAHFVGVVDLVGGEPFVRDLMPPPRLLALPEKQANGLPWAEGAIVEIRRNDSGDAVVENTLAAAGTPKARTWMVASENRLDAVFPAQAMKETAQIEASAATSLQDKALVDRRKEPFFAIDNPGSTDIDQAMRLTKRPDGGYIVDYALADPSAYIKPGMSLFNEAMQRGASYYLPGLSIPMLPPELSEGIVSLNAHEDHRAMVITIHLDKDGNVEKNSVSRAVIHSQAQLTYEGVSAEIEGKGKIGNDEHGKAVPKAVREQLALFQEIGEKRLEKSKARGVVDPDRREMRIGFDDGKFFLKDANSLIASKLNAEFSIMANVGGAEQMLSSTVPGIYIPGLFRTHAEPGDGAYQALARQTKQIAKQHGLPSTWAWNTQKESLSQWVDRVKELPKTERERELSLVLQMSAVRINVSSEYSRDPSPHSGLKVDAYGRFSAPMREQVGLMSHAVVFAKDALERAVVAGGLSAAEAQALWAPLLLGATVAPGDIPSSRQQLAREAQALLSTSPAELGAAAKALAQRALAGGPLNGDEQKLVDAVFDRAKGAGNSGKMKQGQVDGAGRKLLFDDLFMSDLGGNPLGNPNAPKRDGFVTAVAPGKVYIQLKDPDIEVRLATDDLRYFIPGANFHLVDEGCAIETHDANAGPGARIVVGEQLKVQATHHDGDLLHFAIVG